MAYDWLGAIKFAQGSSAMGGGRIVKRYGASFGCVRYDRSGGCVGLKKRRESEGYRVAASRFL